MIDQRGSLRGHSRIDSFTGECICSLNECGRVGKNEHEKETGRWREGLTRGHAVFMHTIPGVEELVS